MVKTGDIPRREFTDIKFEEQRQERHSPFEAEALPTVGFCIEQDALVGYDEDADAAWNSFFDVIDDKNAHVGSVRALGNMSTVLVPDVELTEIVLLSTGLTHDKLSSRRARSMADKVRQAAMNCIKEATIQAENYRDTFLTAQYADPDERDCTLDLMNGAKHAQEHPFGIARYQVGNGIRPAADQSGYELDLSKNPIGQKRNHILRAIHRAAGTNNQSRRIRAVANRWQPRVQFFDIDFEEHENQRITPAHALRGPMLPTFDLIFDGPSVKRI